MKQIIPYNIFENDENLIKLYHGGNLDMFSYKPQPSKAKRVAYGAGLYLTSDERVARGYAKGNRKLYEVYLEKGVEMSNVNISQADIIEFFNSIYSVGTVKKIMKHFERVFDKYGDKISADSMDAVIFNNSLVKTRNTVDLIEFYVNHGIDYQLNTNTFGYGDETYIVYNMNKIMHIKRIK